VKIKRESLLYFVAYSLFGLLAFVFSFIVTFPVTVLEEKALDFLEAKTGCVLKIKSRQISFPISIELKGVDATCPKSMFTKGATEQATIKVPALEFSLEIWQLLLNQQGELDFNAAWGDGTLSGHLSITQDDRGLSFSLSQLAGSKLQVKEIDPGLAGLLTATGEGSFRAKELIKGKGKISLVLDEARFTALGGAKLPVGEVSFDKIQAQLVWSEGRVVLEAFSATGTMVDLKSESGTLVLRAPINRSFMNLSFLATPKGSIKQMASMFVRGYNGKTPLKLRVSGPVNTAKISVNGRTVRP
jgi:type II secretion system protein N